MFWRLLRVAKTVLLFQNFTVIKVKFGLLQKLGIMETEFKEIHLFFFSRQIMMHSMVKRMKANDLCGF